MSAKTIEILEQLKTLGQLETAKLVKQMEVTFGVDASTPQIISIQKLDEKEIEQPAPVQTEFDVVLEGVSADKKIAVLKVVRTLIQLELKAAKDFVESTPKVVQEGISKDEAEEIKHQLESAGATVSIR